MTLRSSTYNWLTCNGRVDNLMQPQCPAVSPGGFNDPELVLKGALALGWTENAGRHLCPAHSTDAQVPSDAKPARKPRNKPVRPEPEHHEFQEGNQ